MVQGAWLFLLPCCLTDLFDGARIFLFIGGIGSCHVALDGLNSPSRLENVLFGWPFSWILGLTSQV